MNTLITNRYARRLALGVALGLGVVSSALADPIGGSVPAINTLVPTYVTNLTVVGANGLTNQNIVTGTIDNNDDAGWRLTVVSTNVGRLCRAGSCDGAGRELLYTNITLVQTGGTLGAGLTNPHNVSRNIVTGASAGDVAGTTHFNTGANNATPGVATTATVAYAFALRISAAANTTLLEGSYTDTLTLTLNNDS